MANMFDQFDTPQPQGNMFDRFDDPNYKDERGVVDTITSRFKQGVETAGAGLSAGIGRAPDVVARDIADTQSRRTGEELDFQAKVRSSIEAFDKDKTVSNFVGILGTLASNPKLALGEVAQSIGSSLPSYGAAAAGTAGGALVAGPIGAVAGGIAGYLLGNLSSNVQGEIASKLEQDLTARRVDLTNPTAIEAALRAEPKLIEDAREYGAKKGAATTAVETVVELATLGASKLAKPAVSTASRLARAAGAMGAQGVGEGLGSAAGSAAVGEEVSPGQAIYEGALGAVAGTPEAIGALKAGQALRKPELPPPAPTPTAADVVTSIGQARSVDEAIAIAADLVDYGRLVTDDRLKAMQAYMWKQSEEAAAVPTNDDVYAQGKQALTPSPEAAVAQSFADRLAATEPLQRAETPGMGVETSEPSIAQPATASQAPAPAMQGMLDRITAKIDANPSRVTTSELAFVSQHHPNQVRQEQAQAIAEVRRNYVREQHGSDTVKQMASPPAALPAPRAATDLYVDTTGRAAPQLGDLEASKTTLSPTGQPLALPAPTPGAKGKGTVFVGPTGAAGKNLEQVGRSDLNQRMAPQPTSEAQQAFEAQRAELAPYADLGPSPESPFDMSTARGKKSGAGSSVLLPAKQEVDQTVVTDLNRGLANDAAATGVAAPEMVAVAPDQLPEDRHTHEDGSTTISRAEAADIQNLAKVYGKEAVFVDDVNGDGPEGAVVDSDDKHVFVAVRSKGAHQLVIVAHEIAHHMERDAPELHAKLVEGLVGRDGAVTEDSPLVEFYRYYHNKPGMPAGKVVQRLSDPEVQKKLIREFVADVFGNRHAELKTHQMLFNAAKSANDPGLIHRIAQFIIGYIDRLLQRVKLQKFETDRLVKDLQRARKLVREVAMDYAVRQGKRTKLQAEADYVQASRKTEPKKQAEPQVQQSPQREDLPDQLDLHLLDVDRAERFADKTGVKLSAAEEEAIKDSAKKFNIDAKRIKATVLGYKADHPTSQGWGEPVFAGLLANGDKGVKYRYETQPYTFSDDANGRALDPSSPEYQKRVDEFAEKMTAEVRGVFERAQAGDQNAKVMIRQAGWYSNMRVRLRQEFGGLGDLFADSLGATSPNTPVRDNWTSSLEVLRRASRGDYDDKIAGLEQWVTRNEEFNNEFRVWFDEQLAAGKSKKDIKESTEYKEAMRTARELREMPEDLVPTKESGKKFGVNSEHVAKALVNMWRTIKAQDPDLAIGATAPKAINFSGNLIGYREGATIDVWAARMLQRLNGGTRAPSAAEDGVSGNMLPSGKTTLQFGFGQDVFHEAAQRIREDAAMSKDPILSRMQDDDLQAVVWFLEKEVWTKNNWTTPAGEGGSFEFEASLSGTSEQERVRELRKIIDSTKSKPADRAQALEELKALHRPVDRYVGGLSIQQSAETQGRDYVPDDKAMAKLAKSVKSAIYKVDDGLTVMGSKVLSTLGRYGGDERSLDIEIVARENFDARPLMVEMLKQAQAAKQDSMFLSRVLPADQDYDPLIHRPGIEIYFRDQGSMDKVEPLLGRLANAGVDMYTVIVDGRRSRTAQKGAAPGVVGVRFQYVPEFDVRYGGDIPQSDSEIQSKIEAEKTRLQDMAQVLRKMEGVSFAGQFWYETDVRFLNEYQGAIDAFASPVTAGVDRAAGGAAWSGRSIREGLEAAAQQRDAADRGQGAASAGSDAAVTVSASQRRAVTATPPFKKWFGSSTIVDEAGQPKVMYHGTGRDITAFRPKQAGAIYVTDNAKFAESFANLSEDWMTNEAFDNLTPEQDAQFDKDAKKIVGPKGRQNKDDYREALLTTKRTLVTDTLPSRANVLPLYVKAEKPFDYDDAGMRKSVLDRVFADRREVMISLGATKAVMLNREEAEQLLVRGAWDMIESRQFQKALHEGDFDSFWVKEGGRKNLAVYEPTQLKSAIGNNGQFSVENPRIDRSQQRAPSLGKLDAAQEAALKVAGAITGPPPTVRQQMQAWKANLGLRMAQGMVDQFRAIKDVDPKAYLLARMSKGTDGLLEAMFLYGKPKLRDGIGDVTVNPNGGFARVLANLDGEHSRFIWWVAALRAERLKAEGRENLLTDSDISALKTLNDNDAEHPERAKKFRDALDSLNDYNKAVLNIARESGLIDDEGYDVMKDQPYVPFYRVMEDGVQGPGFGSGLTRQYFSKKLKGGKEAINQDLLQNMLLNWSHVFEAAAKNRAAKAAIDAAVDLGIAYPVASGTKGATTVREEGIEKSYMIEDPYLFEAVSAVNYASPSWYKPFSTVKRWLTVGVTANPAFKIRNLIRDSVQAIGTSELGFNPFGNVKRGFMNTDRQSQTYASMLAGGGMMRFGTIENSAHAETLVKKQLKGQGIVLDENGFKKLAGQIGELWETYNDFGDRLENVNRAALYEQLIAKGKSHAEASFMSRDLMDFSMSGRWPVVRFLSQSVPFLNARMQGLYKLGRAFSEDKRKLGIVTTAVIMASMALLFAYEDDEDWKKREDWDRDNYWWFKIGETAVRIPKPFELGAIGTLVERTWELGFDKEMTGKRYGKQIANLFFEQFSMSPVPQLAKPFVDVYSNKEGFTGRDIESQGMERMRPEDRVRASTSTVARFLGQLGLPEPLQLVMGRYSALSPVQIDYLIRGYAGWVGTTATVAMDYGMRPLQDRGEKPDMKLKDVFLLGSFVESLPGGSSRYVTQMYDEAREVSQVYASWREAVKSGDATKAAEIATEERDKLARYRRLDRTSDQVGQLNTQIRRVEESKVLSSETKRRMIDRLREQQDVLARGAVRPS